jgi:hypothetical protein
MKPESASEETTWGPWEQDPMGALRRRRLVGTHYEVQYVSLAYLNALEARVWEAEAERGRDVMLAAGEELVAAQQRAEKAEAKAALIETIHHQGWVTHRVKDYRLHKLDRIGGLLLAFLRGEPLIAYCERKSQLISKQEDGA